MGGRGASFTGKDGYYVNDKGKVIKYGTEFRAVLEEDNIKFIKFNGADNAKIPLETMTKGRIYAIINDQEQVKAITLYDDTGKKYKQIDIRGQKHKIDGKPVIPHVHYGYEHSENGTELPDEEDKKLIDKVLKIWDNKSRKY